MRRVLLPLLLTACAKQPASPATWPPEEITLTFAMQPGWRGSYTTVVETRSLHEQSTQVDEHTVEGTVSVAALDGAHLGWTWEPATASATRTIDGADTPLPLLEEGTLGVMLRLPRTGRIAPQGAWAGLVNADDEVLAEFLASVDWVIPAIRPWLPSAASRARFDAALSVPGLARMQQQLRDELAAEWDRRIGQWSGATLAAGERYVASFRQAHPGTGGLIPWSVEYEIHVDERCYVDERYPVHCVRIDTITRPDPEAFRAETEALTRLERARAGQPDAFSLAEASMELVGSYMLEPTSMRPWSQVEVTTTRMVPAEPAGTTTEIVKRAETTYDWTR